MTIVDTTAATPMRRVAAACLVGSAIEFYDFMIYGTAAALVFPTVFFPHLSPALGTIASMGTFASAFVSRPIGGVAFGYFGDRLGRKKTLIATLLIMAVSTMSVGAVPSTATIGVAAPLILVALRSAARVCRRRGMGGLGAAERRIRPGRPTRPLRDVHAARRRSRGGVVEPDVFGRELHHRREQSCVHAVGVADSVPDQRRSDRHRLLCADADRRDSGVRRGEGPKLGPESPDRGVVAVAAPRDRPGRWQHPGRYVPSSTCRTPT